MVRIIAWMGTVLTIGLALSAAMPRPADAAGDAVALEKGQGAAVSPAEARVPRFFAIASQPGDYIVVAFDGGRGRFDVDQVDGEGQHIRRFVDGAGGETEFRFVADGPALLRVTAQEAGAYSLKIAAKVVTVATSERRTEIALPQSPSLASLARQLAAGGGTDAFWSRVEAEGTPLIEDGPGGQMLMTFLGRGARRNIRLFGAPSGDHEILERLGDSDVWFKSFLVPADTRLSYQLAYDVPDVPGSERDRRVAILATAKADPFNRHPWPADAIDAFNQESTVSLAGAPPQPFVEKRAIPEGKLDTFRMESAALDNTRDIILYTPPGFDPKNPDNLLLFVFDAKEYLSTVPTPVILDNMAAAGVLPPVVAVFIANPDRAARARELPDNADFAAFMAKELLPRIAAETGMTPQGGRTILAGSSFGGLASATVAMRYPKLFGNVLSLSGSFWWSPEGTPKDKAEHVAQAIATRENLGLRFFLAPGLFETRGMRDVGGILETNRHLRDVLVAKGYDVVLREYAGGHDYFVWRGAISDGLVALFGKSR